MAEYLINLGVKYDLAVLIVFLILTPIIFLFSLFLTKYIDNPSKDFSHDLDLFLRIDENENNSEKEKKTCC